MELSRQSSSSNRSYLRVLCVPGFLDGEAPGRSPEHFRLLSRPREPFSIPVTSMIDYFKRTFPFQQLAVGSRLFYISDAARNVELTGIYSIEPSVIVRSEICYCLPLIRLLNFLHGSYHLIMRT